MLYFYTVDGTQVLGPVGSETLRKLGRAGVLHAGSSICPQGETEWRPFSTASFSKTTPALRPLSRAPAKKTVAVEDEEFSEDGFLPLFLNIVTLYVAWQGLGCYMACLPSWVRIEDPHQRTWIELAIGLVLIVVLPWTFSLFFKGLRRVIVRTVGVVIITIALMVAYFTMPTPEEMLAARENVMTVELMKELSAKVQIAQSASAACHFDITTIAGRDDIAQRRTQFLKYLQTEADILQDIKTFTPRMSKALLEVKASSDLINQDLAVAKKQYDGMASSWQSRLKLTDDQIAQLDFLNQTFGSWSVSDGRFAFRDQATLDSYNALRQTLLNDAQAVRNPVSRSLH